MKICSTCGVEKPPSLYYASNKSVCKECVKIKNRYNRKSKIDYYRQYDKIRKTKEYKPKYVKVEVGDVFRTNDGSIATVIDYKSSKDIYIKFDTGNITKTSSSDLRKGRVGNVLSKSLLGIGYTGEGLYSVSKDGKKTEAYKSWKGMMTRCYYTSDRNKTYTDCTVSEDWHNFQNFAEWFYSDNYRKTGWHLDKDIIKQGNRVYCKEFCAFVPPQINILVPNQKQKDNNLPVGVVSIVKGNKIKYRAVIGYYGGIKYLGQFESKQQAAEAYKEARVNYINEVTESFNGLVDPRVKESLLNWKF